MSVKQLSREQFRQEYLKSLGQDIKNINTNLQANRFFVETGQPSRPSDVRTITEKTADVEGIKSLLRAELKKITDSTNAGLIIQGLGDDELKFLYTQFSGIEREISPRFKTGVPADIFINFLRKYIERFEATGGIEATLAEQLETALEPVIEEIASERTERKTPRSEIGSGDYTSGFDRDDIPVDDDWSNFTKNIDIQKSWTAMKNEVRRQKKSVRLTQKQTDDREALLKSMLAVGPKRGTVPVPTIKKWSKDNPDEFEYLTQILGGVVGAGIKMVVIEPKNKKISGRGVSVPTPSKPQRKKLGFKNFGKYIIDEIGLDDDIVSIRSLSKAPIPSLPRQRVHKRVSNVLKTIAGGGMPSYEDIGELKDGEKKFLNKVLKTARLSDKIKVPNPDKSKEEAEMERFNILKGQLISGNDSSELVKEFKSMLIRFSNSGRLPKRETNEILSELLMLGM
jgi:uncharacterized protein YnzC (UPF0291/DUF896 family)